MRASPLVRPAGKPRSVDRREMLEGEAPTSFGANVTTVPRARPLAIGHRTGRLKTAQGAVKFSAPQPRGLQLNEHVAEPGDLVFQHARRLGLEGIVSKHLGSRYIERPISGLGEAH
jgi:hypothetical protein